MNRCDNSIARRGRVLLAFMVPGVILTRWCCRLIGWDMDRDRWTERKIA